MVQYKKYRNDVLFVRVGVKTKKFIVKMAKDTGRSQSEVVDCIIQSYEDIYASRNEGKSGRGSK
jgi:hypothetical protein